MTRAGRRAAGLFGLPRDHDHGQRIQLLPTRLPPAAAFRRVAGRPGPYNDRETIDGPSARDVAGPARGGIKDTDMASRPNPRPAGPNRRRPGPYLPGSLILMLIIVALFVALIIGNPLGSPQSIDYNDFIKLSEKHNLKKVTFIGKDRADGEVVNNDEEFTKSLNLSG